MSINARRVLIFSILTGVTVAQPFTARGLSDASNSEMSTARVGDSRPPLGLGTISVQELEHPLEEKGLQALKKAQELLAAGDSTRAMEHLRTAMKYPGAEPVALSILAAQHLKRGDVDTAIIELQQAIALSPGSAANHSNLAYALGIRGRSDEGLKEARTALQLDPGHPRYRYVIGQLLLQMDRLEEAKFHLKRAAEEMPSARTLLVKYFGQ